MGIFSNIDLFTVGLSSAAILILGFIIFFNGRKSITNKYFLFLAVFATLYTIFNYLSYQSSSADTALWLLRFVIFFAVWYAFSIFKLMYVFPDEKKKMSKIFKYSTWLLVIIVSILTLTPLVFVEIAEFSINLT